MAGTSLDEDIQSWHRRFAARANDHGWDLVEAPDRCAAEDRHMLHLAHAAAYHWSAIGTPLHKARADLLVAAAHAQLGLGPTAVTFAAAAWDEIEKNDPEAWERCLAHAILAHAFHAAGSSDGHARAFETAETAFAGIPEGPNRDIVNRTLVKVPRP